MWKLNPVIWRDIIEVNMKEWGTPAITQAGDLKIELWFMIWHTNKFTKRDYDFYI